MSSELKSLIIRNDLALPKEQVDRLLSMNGRSALYPLSPDREPGPFLLYCCGDDLDTIAVKINMPRDIVVATAIQYKWPEKAAVLKRDRPGIVPCDLQKDLINTILVATVVSMQRELSDVIAGKKEAKDCSLIPSSPAALQKLMEMVTSINNYNPPAPLPAPGSTIVHAQNVQINQGVKEPTDEDKEKRAVMLNEVEKSAGN